MILKLFVFIFDVGSLLGPKSEDESPVFLWVLCTWSWWIHCICSFPQASNQTLLDKFKRQHEGNSYIEFPAVMEPAFIIRHYAGKVKYGVKVRRALVVHLYNLHLLMYQLNHAEGRTRFLSFLGNPESITNKALCQEHLRHYMWTSIPS